MFIVTYFNVTINIIIFIITFLCSLFCIHLNNTSLFNSKYILASHHCVQYEKWIFIWIFVKDYILQCYQIIRVKI